MSTLDYLVLLTTMLGIAGYGYWQTRHQQKFETYLKGDRTQGWGTIGLSVMATQASAITFLSTPGQAYDSGLGFVQNYFGMPFALILICAVFLPIYRRLNVYTAYEYLGKRFDSKTRLLGALLFLLQRGLAAGITIYAPAIILSTVLGWRLDVTILATGALVIVYTVSGGSVAVNLTQRHQMAVIFGGMVAAFVVVLMKIPEDISLFNAFVVAEHLGRLDAISFSFNPDQRYTVWSGLLGGFFLSLSYFGTDQSQVQRYLTGRSLRESRMGLMFNAVLKIPMQFFILLLGVMVFVFYQFAPPPVFFNEAAWRHHVQQAAGPELRALETRFNDNHTAKQASLRAWLTARDAGDTALTEERHALVQQHHVESQAIRTETKAALLRADSRLKTKDSDYVFITFVLQQLPHGLIGLLIAVIFAAALSSTASELNALGGTTTVDLYRHVIRPNENDGHYLRMSRTFTALWGVIAVGFALFARFADNLIEAVNILGSIFYGVVLGMFLVAFFLKRIGGTAVFWSAIVAQTVVILLYRNLSIGYLWYNFIGCALCVVLSLLFHFAQRAAQPRNP